MPFWVVIFAEGTRFTEEKHEKSVKYCKEKGLPVFKVSIIAYVCVCVCGYVYVGKCGVDGWEWVGGGRN